MGLNYFFLQNAPISNFCVINYTFSYIFPDWETFFTALTFLKKLYNCMKYQ